MAIRVPPMPPTQQATFFRDGWIVWGLTLETNRGKYRCEITGDGVTGRYCGFRYAEQNPGESTQRSMWIWQQDDRTTAHRDTFFDTYFSMRSHQCLFTAALA